MVIFDDIQDVQDWLEPFDIDAFWEAVAPWSVFTGEERAHYDQVLADGEVDPATVLFCLKDMACMVLRMRFGLKDRIYDPPGVGYSHRVH